MTTSISHCAIVNKGKLYTFGRNDKGQLGLGDQINRSDGDAFFHVEFSDSDTFITRVFCGKEFTICVTDENKAYGFGDIFMDNSV